MLTDLLKRSGSWLLSMTCSPTNSSWPSLLFLLRARSSTVFCWNRKRCCGINTKPGPGYLCALSFHPTKEWRTPSSWCAAAARRCDSPAPSGATWRHWTLLRSAWLQSTFLAATPRTSSCRTRPRAGLFSMKRDLHKLILHLLQLEQDIEAAAQASRTGRRGFLESLGLSGHGDGLAALNSVSAARIPKPRANHFELPLVQSACQRSSSTVLSGKSSTNRIQPTAALASRR